MTLEELKAAYPDCPDAMDLGETAGAPLWQQIRDGGFTLDEVIAIVRVASSLATLILVAHAPAGAVELAHRLLEQTHTPGFRKYVAAKLRMVQGA